LFRASFDCHDSDEASENKKSLMNASTNGTTRRDTNRIRTLLKEPASKEPVAKPSSKGKKSFTRWLALPVVILAVIAGVSYWIYSSQFEETDDAYVTGHEHPVSFRVAGTISEVLVDDNQLVKEGQPLAKLDPKDFQVGAGSIRSEL
jgi:membrane fusion protein, multidrug efflux system